MQIMPFWIKAIGRKNDNLFDIDTNLRYGSAILSLYIKKSNNQIAPALARYNGAPSSRKYSNRVLQVLRSRWFAR